MFEGPEQSVSVRVAVHEGAVYLDLCNEGWEAVEITASGWLETTRQPVPVKFVRKGNAAPLPRPEGGGTVETLSWKSGAPVGTQTGSTVAPIGSPPGNVA